MEKTKGVILAKPGKMD
jgi:NADPH2:quinone reductase